jgi:hypothetical protein
MEAEESFWNHMTTPPATFEVGHPNGPGFTSPKARETLHGHSPRVLDSSGPAHKAQPCLWTLGREAPGKRR